MNNKVKIKKEDPRRQRDTLILKSWTGALLGICSIMCALFSLFKLLPAIYASNCHIEHSWSANRYPGASFALIESLVNISFLGLLLIGGTLTVVLDYIPRFFLRTLPTKYKHFARRLRNTCDKDKAWKPKNHTVDHYNQELMLENNSHEYDCLQLTENFGAANTSLIPEAPEQSTIFLNDSRFMGPSPETKNVNLSLLTKLV